MKKRPGAGALLLVLALAATWARPLTAARRDGEFEIRVVDAATGEPLPVRMHLQNQRARAVRPPRQLKLPFWKDHFVFPGRVTLTLRPGRYTFQLERGPEYPIRSGHFVIERGATDSTKVTMQRFVDMKQEGWWSGDLHVHRAPAEMALLMQAEDLHVAPAITWWNEQSIWKERPLPETPLQQFGDDMFCRVLAGEDERGGGALMYFNLPRPLPLPPRSQPEYPPMARFLEMAKRQFPGCHVDIEKPFWWDVPVWVAMGQADSIGLAHNHMQRGGVLDNEAWGKPRDTKIYPGPLGNGRWSQDIYYHLLNCGVRLPPSAGSASGVLPNPVGYNRVYVHCGDRLDHEAWWEGLRAGRVVVTNGPLLRPRVNGQLPGFVFRASAGNTVTLSPSVNLALRDEVKYLEVVKNGKVAHEVRLDEYQQRRGRLPAVEFTRSGWLLIRAVSTCTDTYRFASTGPYYVEIGGQPRISRDAAQFFVDWVAERIGKLAVSDPEQKREVFQYQERARQFWQARHEAANAP